MSVNADGDLNILDLIVNQEAVSRSEYETELAAARKASDERSRWDHSFFELACWLQRLVKHDGGDETKSGIGDYCHDIADLIRSENSLPNVEQFQKVRRACRKKYQSTGGKTAANLPGIVAILKLIDRAIREDSNQLNDGIDKIGQVAGSHAYAPFNAQELLQNDLRQNPRETDFESILTGRLTRENVLRRAQADVNPYVLIDGLAELARMIDAHGIESSTVREQAGIMQQMLVEAHNWRDGEKISTEMGCFAGIAKRIQHSEPIEGNTSHSIRLFAIKLSRLFSKEPKQPTELERRRAEVCSVSTSSKTQVEVAKSIPTQSLELGGKSASTADANNEPAGPEINWDEIERETPALETKSVEWVKGGKKNEKNIGLTAQSQKDYRAAKQGGQVAPDKMLGIDGGGRVWRRSGTTTNGHVYYQKKTLKGQNKP